jgi:hypothetical protein
MLCRFDVNLAVFFLQPAIIKTRLPKDTRFIALQFFRPKAHVYFNINLAIIADKFK